MQMQTAQHFDSIYGNMCLAISKKYHQGRCELYLVLFLALGELSQHNSILGGIDVLMATCAGEVLVSA